MARLQGATRAGLHTGLSGELGAGLARWNHWQNQVGAVCASAIERLLATIDFDRSILWIGVGKWTGAMEGIHKALDDCAIHRTLEMLSAESFLDRLRNTPDVLAAVPSITCPTLYIRGDQEDAAVYPAEEFARRAAGPCDVVVLDRCDHFYNGCEDMAAHTIIDWLRQTLGGTD